MLALQILYFLPLGHIAPQGPTSLPLTSHSNAVGCAEIAGRPTGDQRKFGKKVTEFRSASELVMLPPAEAPS